ncbi:TadE/TadG family type IV pilus assembly protein [Oryzibacter oryziterrae]|uniref:TadE/TadG family type IV pilus assembly protein n=1 Tax=Oryzibacter oryziterrae TaxID=2766474 RepID=UPI001F3BE046|nr:TadE/TadG family type IV pilus assembly protein [Oryzibacter oryziterrae]
MFARYLASQGGSTAIEFALISIPFVALLFAIFESALMFFMGDVLSTATSDAARLIRTGEAKASGMSAAQFKDTVCAGMYNLVDCQGHLYVDVQAYTSFNTYTPTSPVDSHGNIAATHFTAGEANQIVVVRSFYDWPIYFDFLAASTSGLTDGRVLIGSVVAFRTEPFPW